MLTTFKKYFLYLFLALFLFVVSEAIFNYYNRTVLLISTYFKIASFCIENKNYDCGSFFLSKLASVKYQYYKELYPDLYKEPTDTSISASLLQRYGVDKNDLESSKLIYIYYKLGLTAYKNGDLDSAFSILQKTIYLAPDTSFIYVELSNMYIKSGNSDEARSVMDRCMKFVYPQKHCQEFLNTLLLNDKSIEPGFLESAIQPLF